MKFSNALIFLQLVVSGAIIGLFVALLPGFAGYDVIPHIEAIGSSLGAISVAGLKILHLL